MTERRELLGVLLRGREELTYPGWQFDPETGETLEFYLVGSAEPHVIPSSEWAERAVEERLSNGEG